MNSQSNDRQAVEELLRDIKGDLRGYLRGVDLLLMGDERDDLEPLRDPLQVARAHALREKLLAMLTSMEGA